MAKKLDPIISEFETQEQADSYDKWFRAKVQASIDDPRSGIPHDQVMAELDAIIEAAASVRKAPDGAGNYLVGSGPGAGR